MSVFDFVEMEKVNPNDEILGMEFKHVCGGLLEAKSTKDINCELIICICEKPCDIGRCAGSSRYSGFDFMMDRSKVPGEPDRAQRQRNQQNLCVLLPEYIQRPTADTRERLHNLLKDGRLKFTFCVR
jgi:hypothetical protein